MGQDAGAARRPRASGALGRRGTLPSGDGVAGVDREENWKESHIGASRDQRHPSKEDLAVYKVFKEFTPTLVAGEERRGRLSWHPGTPHGSSRVTRAWNWHHSLFCPTEMIRPRGSTSDGFSSGLAAGALALSVHRRGPGCSSRCGGAQDRTARFPPPPQDRPGLALDHLGPPEG